MVCKREDVGCGIKKTLKPEDVKKLGSGIDPNEKWDRNKNSLVKGIVKQKFIENNELKLKLLSTKGFKLQEATVDKYWGIGVPVYSKSFKYGNFTGLNTMGTILEEIRNEFLPKQEQDGVGNYTPVKQIQQHQQSPTRPQPQHNDSKGKKLKQTEENGLMEHDNDNDNNNGSTTSKYIAEMGESSLKSMLKVLKSTNTGEDIQRAILLRLGHISAGDM